jgi:RNA polymerase sigma-70 factor, ECF subfamily
LATTKQEALWVLRAQCDDREALELLLRGVQPFLHRYLTRVVGGSHSDDVLQEVLITVSRKLKLLHTPELFRPWAYRIATRIAFRHLKKQRRWPEQVLDESALEVATPEDRSSEPLRELLDLDSISPASRAVLVLHFEEELTLPEVAAILGIPLGTAKSRLAYGLAAIRKRLSTRKD